MLSLIVSLLVTGLVPVCMAPALVHAQLNEHCTISVLNRTANVRPDGSWRIDNILFLRLRRLVS